MATVTKLYLLMGPRRLKDITRLETALMVPFSRCLDYKGRLTELQLLPLMYYYDLQDLLFLIECLLSPPDNFDILQYVPFSTHGTTAGKLKVNYKHMSTTRHFYFNQVIRLWNAIPPSCLLPTIPLEGGCYCTFWTISFLI